MKLTFIRNFSASYMIKWHQLEGASSIVPTDETDALIWKYDSKGEYSTSSLYAIINFGGGGHFCFHSCCLANDNPSMCSY
jgi:hypothetical protein